MRHDNDDIPMTREKYIKLKGMEYINRFRAVGISYEKSKLASLVLVLELKENYLKNFTGTAADKKKKLDDFDLLERGIKAY
jgi:hypothetical protein